MYLRLLQGIGLVVVVGLFGSLARPVTAQPVAVLHQFQHAFEAGDAHGVLAGAAERVEVALFDDGKLYSRAQATYVLEAFFGAYPPDRFEVQHESTTEGSWFVAGLYYYLRGAQPLHVYLRCRQRGGQWELRELRIAERLRE